MTMKQTRKDIIALPDPDKNIVTIQSAINECWLPLEDLMKKFCGPVVHPWLYTGFTEYPTYENLGKLRKAREKYLQDLCLIDKPKGPEEKDHPENSLDIFQDPNVKGFFRRHFINNNNSDSNTLAKFLSPYEDSFRKKIPTEKHKHLYDANRLAQLYVEYFFMIKAGEISTNHKEAALRWHQEDWSFLGKRKYDYLQIILQQLYTPEEAQELLELPSRKALDAWIVKGSFEGSLSLVPAAPNDPRHPSFYLWEEDLLADVSHREDISPELQGRWYSPLHRKLYKAIKYGYWPLTNAILDYKNTPSPDTLITYDPAEILYNRLKVIMGKEGKEKLYTSRLYGLQDRKELAAAYYLLAQRAERIKHEINDIREKERINLNADVRYKECVSQLLSPAIDLAELEKDSLDGTDCRGLLEDQWIDPADAGDPFLDALEQAQDLTEKMQRIIRLKLELNRMIREPENRYEIYAALGGINYNFRPRPTSEEESKYGIGPRTVELSFLPSIVPRGFAFLGPVRIPFCADTEDLGNAGTAPKIIAQPGETQPFAQVPSQTMRR